MEFSHSPSVYKFRNGACIDCGRKIASAVCLSGSVHAASGSYNLQGDTVIL